MSASLPDTAHPHRVDAHAVDAVRDGTVAYRPLKSLWFSAMLLGAAIGGSMTVSWSAIALFVITTAIALLFGHSLGNHRLLVHRSFQCPRWLECGLVYCGTLVGIAGPLGLLRQHDLRDFAQRQPRCHDFLRHGQRAWRDAWWQLHCDLVLSRPPTIALETATTSNRFYQFLERSWMAQQVPWAILAYVAGG